MSRAALAGAVPIRSAGGAIATSGATAGGGVTSETGAAAGRWMTLAEESMMSPGVRMMPSFAPI
jgi:hypothetical protein